ncbi:Ejaculatory bulb-specific protein 3 [Eumeta japonica]|uniref:Ejaculatory bulb-specific protein 3 n=1 Tax=Eumeta variegata TaxID=151549 RepID=A0A4C1T3F5_EUMVA|nr:Ejaculatory bulb-specific protein 3 [Eumeta japonica]
MGLIINYGLDTVVNNGILLCSQPSIRAQKSPARHRRSICEGAPGGRRRTGPRPSDFCRDNDCYVFDDSRTTRVTSAFQEVQTGLRARVGAVYKRRARAGRTRLRLHGPTTPDHISVTSTNMQSAIVLLMLALAAVVLARPDTYTDRYDNIDLDEVVNNRRLLVPYVKCVLDQGKCSPEGKELKSPTPSSFSRTAEAGSEDLQRTTLDKPLLVPCNSVAHIREALENNCGKCTNAQRNGTRKVIAHLINHEEDYWTELRAKYDPQSKYVTKYEADLRTVKKRSQYYRSILRQYYANNNTSQYYVADTTGTTGRKSISDVERTDGEGVARWKGSEPPEL